MLRSVNGAGEIQPLVRKLFHELDRYREPERFGLEDLFRQVEVHDVYHSVLVELLAAITQYLVAYDNLAKVCRRRSERMTLALRDDRDLRNVAWFRIVCCV